MTARVLVAPDEQERYLIALLDSTDGVDLAEFTWLDPSHPSGRYRVWPFQNAWFRHEATLQADQCGRGVGKCLVGTTMLTLAGGRRMPIASLVGRTVAVATADDHPEHGLAHAVREGTVFASGTKPCLRLRTTSGRTLTASGDHPLYAEDGWRKLDELSVGDEIIIAEHSPMFGSRPLSDGQLRLLAHVCASGGVSDRDRDITYSIVAAAGEKAWSHDLVDALRDLDAAPRPMNNRPLMWRLSHAKPKGTPGIGAFLRRAGLAGAHGEAMRIPHAVETLSADQLARFCGRLLQPPSRVTAAGVRYQLMGADMAPALAALLTRFGIHSRARRKKLSARGRGQPSTTVGIVEITEPDSLARFARIIGPHVLGSRREALDALTADLPDPGPAPTVRFETITEIVDAGEQPVYDLTMTGAPQFLADNILVHNSTRIIMRAFNHPFVSPGEDLLITAPELNHLRPLTDGVERRILESRMARELLSHGRGQGLSRQPHWQARFANGARVITRIPNRDGKGVKGMHALRVHLDEAQDYPSGGWTEIQPTLKRGSPGAQWHIHGVPRGVRDRFYQLTADSSDFVVHRYYACHRPDWTDAERAEAISTYGGSARDPDYKRNVFGDHGDSTNPLFVLSRFIACVDLDEASEYNTEVYAQRNITAELLEDHDLDSLLDLPGIHRDCYSGAPRGWSTYYGGCDIGMTSAPSEILIFGQRTGTELLELLLRVHMERVDTEHQVEVVHRLFEFYGNKLAAFGLDRTGIGHSVWDLLDKSPIGKRVFGWHFSEKVAVGLREPGENEDPTDIDALIERRELIEHASDVLRVDLVDKGRLRLPADNELLGEWQGQTYRVERSSGNPYGKRVFSKGKMHCVDTETEILTGRGWTRYDQLSTTDEALTLDMETGTSRWSPVEQVYVYPAPAQMVSMELRSFSALCTSEHRWPVRYYRSDRREHGPLHFTTTDRMRDPDCVPLAVPHLGASTQPKYDDALVELVAWFWTEGGGSRSNTSITQSHVVHPEHCDRIRTALIAVFGLPGRNPHGLWREEVCGRRTAFVLRVPAAKVLRALAPLPDRDGRRAPVPTMTFLRSLTTAQLELFLRISELGDGNHSPNSKRRVFQHLRDIEQADMIQVACTLAGVPTSMTRRVNDMSRSGFSHTVELVTSYHRRPAKVREVVDYSGLVWCPRTCEGTWLARRHGTVYWTANSLDGGKMMAAAKTLPAIQAMIDRARNNAAPSSEPVYDIFLGAY